MTVSELIEALKKFDPYCPVFVPKSSDVFGRIEKVQGNDSGLGGEVVNLIPYGFKIK